MPTIHIHQNALFYTARRGDEPPLVLIHGAGGNHMLWPAPFHRLARRAVYALDLPGHGRSSGPGRQQIEEYAADLVAFLDALAIERAVLVGHSMGGAIAQTVALSAPGRVAALALVATGARLRVAPALIEGLSQAPQQTVETIMQWAWGPGAPPEMIEQGRQTMLKAGADVLLGDFLACDRFDLREQIGQISAPTLVLTGSEDRMTPPRLGQSLAESIPAARFQLVEGAGHMLMLERPAETAQAIGAFLADAPRAPKAS